MKQDLIEAKDNIRGCEVVKFSQSILMRYETRKNEYSKWIEKFIELDNMEQVAKFLKDHGYINSYSLEGNDVTMYKGYTSSFQQKEVELSEIELGYEDVKHFAALRELTLVAKMFSIPTKVLSVITNYQFSLPGKVWLMGI